MMTKRETYDELTKLVTAHLGTITHDGRETIVAWVTKSYRVHVAREFPKWKNGFDGLTAVTSCGRNAPVDNVVSRLFGGFEDCLAGKLTYATGFAHEEI